MSQQSKPYGKAALFNDKDEILILRRSKTDTVRPGDYDFPGGKLDKGEGPDEAMVREIKEEIGLSLDIKNLEMVYTDTAFREGRNTMRFLYVGRITGKQELTLSYEHDEYYWMSIEEALEKFDHPVWAKGLRYALKHNLLQ